MSSVESSVDKAPDANIQRSLSTKSKSSTAPTTTTQRRIQQAQGVRLIPLLLKSVKSAGLLLAVWLVGYKHFNISWVLVSSFVYVALSEYRKKRCTLNNQSIACIDETLARVDELPSWVYFPDVDRAEWLNKMILQMWPYIGTYIKNLLKVKVEPVVNSVLPSAFTPFTFDTIDLGSVPPRVGGVKVYIDNVKRDEIIIDMEVAYASDSDLKVSHRGFRAGIKDIQVSGTVRIVFKPILNKVPFIGGLSVCFLTQPNIDFDLTHVANLFDLPLLSTALRTVVGDEIANILVLPNKISVNLVDEEQLHETLFELPKGVLQVFIKEAADLKKADIGFMGRGKSDPYCIITVGMTSQQTRVIEKTLSPTWNEAFEFIVVDDSEANLAIEVFDRDPGLPTDDKLGRTNIELQTLTSSTVDAWYSLEDVQTGRIHIITKWLYFNKDPAKLAEIKSRSEFSEQLSTAALFVNVDSARNLPRVTAQTINKLSMKSVEPSPCVVLQVGNTRRTTTSKNSSTNPKWEETFEFLFFDPTLQELNVDVIDNDNKSKSLGKCKIALKDLLSAKDMAISCPFSLRESGPDTTISLHLQLCILTLESPLVEVDEVTADNNSSNNQQQEETARETTRDVREPADTTAIETLIAASDSDVVPQTVPSGSEAVNKTATEPAATEPAECSAVNEHLLVSSDSNDNVITATTSVLLQSPAVEDLQNLRQRKHTTNSAGQFGYIQLTIRYSIQKCSLIVVVHQCKSLIACDSDNLADPYVRLFLLPDRSSAVKRKTQTVKNNLNPVFDEQFDWSVSKADVMKRTLEVDVKNNVGVFAKGRVNMGRLHINMSTLVDITTATTDWYELCDPDTCSFVH